MQQARTDNAATALLKEGQPAPEARLAQPEWPWRRAGAVPAASVFHFGRLRIGDVKQALRQVGHPVR